MKRLGWFAVLLVVASAVALGADRAFAQERIKSADACGFVVDTTGSAVGGATITAVSGARTLATASSLSDGSFHFAETLNTTVELRVEARGFSRASHEIERLKTVNAKHCRHPVYVVLGAAEGSSAITTKKNALPKPRR